MFKTAKYIFRPMIFLGLLEIIFSSHNLKAQCGANFQELDLGSDTTICNGGQIQIGTQNTYDSYLWNTGSLAPNITISNPGTYSLSVTTLGENLVVNGNFENGNHDFTSSYILGLGGAWGLLSNEGTYAIAANANQTHNNFANCFNYSTGNNSGLMMVVNGSSVPNAVIWQQTIEVEPNTDYQFSTWAASVVSDNPGVLRFMINGIQVGAQLVLSPALCNWQQFFTTWNSGANTTIDIAIINQNTSNAGNDFGIDNISFRPICTSNDQINVAFEQMPQINLGSDTTICAGSSLLLETNEPNYTHLWSTSATTQSIEVVESGLYEVTITSSNSCTASDAISINVEQLPNAGNDGALSFCNSFSPVDLTDYLEQNVTHSGTWFSSNPNLSGFLNTQGVLILDQLNGNYEINYIEAGVICASDTALWEVSVDIQPIAGPNAFLEVCKSAGFSFNPFDNLNFTVPAQEGSWLTNPIIENAFDTSSGVLNPAQLTAGNYTLAYVMLASGACANDTATLNFLVTEMPENSLSSNVVSGCEPLQVAFNTESQGQANTNTLFSLTDGTIFSNVSQFSHEFSLAGCYDIIATSTTNNLCTTIDTFFNYICVNPLPVADFNYSPMPIFADNPTVIFANTSLLNDLNYWEFGDGELSTQINPTHIYDQGIANAYTVTLYVETDHGCRDSISRIVDVLEQLLFYVPNAFTPDGDQYNQVFLPVMTAGYNPYQYRLLIFNRWGELVFESRNAKHGWDGTYGGKPAAEGIYIWAIQFGHQFNSDVYDYKGHFSLLR